MRRPSASMVVSGLALVLAAATLFVALGEVGGNATSEREESRPSGLWRALPGEGDLPEGWRVPMANAGGFGGDAGAQLSGPGRLSGYLTLTRHNDGDDGAQLFLRDFRESADVLPGRKREQVGRLGNESVAVRQSYQSAGLPDGDGPHVQGVIVVWRRGPVVAQLTVQDFGTYLGPGRTQPSQTIDMAAVEKLARAIDARMERELR